MTAEDRMAWLFRQVCRPSLDGAKLAPGAGIDEARQSVPGPAAKRR